MTNLETMQNLQDLQDLQKQLDRALARKNSSPKTITKLREAIRAAAGGNTVSVDTPTAHPNLSQDSQDLQDPKTETDADLQNLQDLGGGAVGQTAFDRLCPHRILRSEKINRKILGQILACSRSATELIHEFYTETGKSTETLHEDSVGMWTTMRRAYEAADPATGVLPVVYSRSKSATAPGASGLGRYFAAGGVGLQGMPRPVRQAIAREFYVDVDMANAHIAILAGLCAAHRIACPKLTEYFTQREMVLAGCVAAANTHRATLSAKQLIAARGFAQEWTRTTAKITILQVLNGGGVTTARCIPFLKDFAAEITVIAAELDARGLSSMFRTEKERQTRHTPVQLRMMIALVGHIESVVLALATRELESAGYTVGTWQFDGCFVERPAANNADIAAFERRLAAEFERITAVIAAHPDTHGAVIQFEIKPMNNPINLERLTPDVAGESAGERPIDDIAADESRAAQWARLGRLSLDTAEFVVQAHNNLTFVFTPRTHNTYFFAEPSGMWGEYPDGTLTTHLGRVLVAELRRVVVHAATPTDRTTLLEITRAINEDRGTRTCTTFFHDIAALARSATYINQHVMDETVGLFAFRNGYVADTTARCVRRVAHADMISAHCGYDYATEAPAPEVTRRVTGIIDSIFESPEMTRFVISLITNMFHGSNPLGRAVFLVGANGANGKGIISALLEAVAGVFGVAGVSSTLFTSGDAGGHDAKLANLKGMRTVLVEEGSQSRPYIAERFKMIVNNGTISASAKGRAEEMWNVRFVPVILSNYKPNFSDGADEAVVRRVLAVEMPFEFKEAHAFDAADPAHRRRDPALRDWIRANITAVRAALVHMAVNQMATTGGKDPYLLQIPPALLDEARVARFITGSDIDFVAVLREDFEMDKAGTTWVSLDELKARAFPDVRVTSTMLAKYVKTAFPQIVARKTSRGNVWPVIAVCRAT